MSTSTLEWIGIGAGLLATVLLAAWYFRSIGSSTDRTAKPETSKPETSTATEQPSEEDVTATFHRRVGQWLAARSTPFSVRPIFPESGRRCVDEDRTVVETLTSLLAFGRAYLGVRHPALDLELFGDTKSRAEEVCGWVARTYLTTSVRMLALHDDMVEIRAPRVTGLTDEVDCVHVPFASVVLLGLAPVLHTLIEHAETVPYGRTLILKSTDVMNARWKARLGEALKTAK